MDNTIVRHPAHWRSTFFGDDKAAPPKEHDKPGKVLLLLDQIGNREKLQNHLRDKYDFAPASEDTLRDGAFDLAIVDTGSFRKWHTQLMDVKVREEPTFLPIILVISQTDLKHRLKAYWDTIDEFIVTPVDRIEFSERVDMLIRARKLAIAQRDKLAYLVTHDRGTGLPNKNLFMEQLANAVNDASILNHQLQITVVHLSMSRIMRSLGQIGLDRAAAACSSRLRLAFGKQAFIAKVTTEEWAIISHPGDGLETSFDTYNRLKEIFEAPLNISGEHIHIEMRIGIGVFPGDATDAMGILDCAMNALSQATDSNPTFYSKTVQHNALRYIRTEAKLYEAIEKNQFELWFQPQLRMEDLKVIGAEALVRWRLPNGTLVPPGDFIAIAESTGLISKIDSWVIEQACRTMAAWRRDGLMLDRVAVNVSPIDLRQENYTDFIRQTLKQYNLPPPILELELTENTVFEANDEMLDKLYQIRNYGMDIAIDDFGTGFSSLSYLHRLPINVLKIDKAFVDNITHSETNAAITKTIVWLAKTFKLRTIAEGVETHEQASYLSSIGVDSAQGFLYARPMPEEQFRMWFQAQ